VRKAPSRRVVVRRSLDADDRRRAEEDLHAVMAEHSGAEGVLLGSGAWIVTARLGR
jgi:hypothetical protein